VLPLCGLPRRDARCARLQLPWSNAKRAHRPCHGALSNRVGRADLLVIKVPRLDFDSCTGPQLSCGSASCQDGEPAARVAVTDARPLCVHPSPSSSAAVRRVQNRAQLTLQESRGPHLLPLRLAGSRAARPLRCVRDADMVQSRDRDCSHVRRPDGVRSAQLGAEEALQGGAPAW
jgi:hypothetical protein